MRHSAATRAIMGAVALAALLCLGFAHLERYPRLLFDEGAYLQVARNLALHRLYAESSSDGPRYYGGPVGMGPTVLLPIAVGFRSMGVGLWQGRAVIALFLLATIGVLYALARHLGGARLAWIATALAVSAPALSLVPLGRQVMGEVPALFFALCALLLWFGRWQRHGILSLAAVGILFGLAAVSKNQFALVLDLSLAVCLALNAFFYKLRPHRWFALPLALTAACHSAWSLTFFALVPPQGRADITACGPRMAAITTAVLPHLGNIWRALQELLRPGAFYGLLLPALAYACVRGRERNPKEQQWSVLATFALVNFGWFLFATIGWVRYAFFGMALASLLVARFIDFILGESGVRLFFQPGADGSDRLYRWLRGAVVVWVAAGVALASARLLGDIALPPRAEAELMADYLDAHVPADAVIETWEPEMAFLSDRRFHFPPTCLLTDAIAYIHYGGRPPYSFYDPLRNDPPQYLLAGEFSTFVAGYRFSEVEQRYRRAKRIGAYMLYEREVP